MKFNLSIPVKVVSGIGCIEQNASMLSLGSHAFIVCGARGAKLSGALDGVTSALDSLGIKYTLFNKSRENPPITMCFECGALCRESGADFVIAIGGGSAIDAAKAVALFAANEDLEMLDIFSPEKRKHSPLPLAAVPTTSGTGSEANGYSVMSMPDGLRKLSFTSEWPRVAFLDPSYTYSMPADGTMSCALDAFSHAAESYLSPKSTEVSRMMASYAAKNIFNIIKNAPTEYSEKDREVLQNAACAAGIAISITGTGFPHPLGYSLTMKNGISHGSACAAFYKYYIEYNMKTPEGAALVKEFASAAGSTPEELASVIPSLAGVKLVLTESEINEYVELIAGAKNYVNSPYVLSNEDKLDIYRAIFLKK